MSLEEFEAKVDEWHASQPDRVCPRCRVKRASREFGIWFWLDTQEEPTPRKTCTRCREALLDPCCLCHQKKPFHWQFNGYSLIVRGASHRINLFCSDCEQDFLALPVFRQKMLIHACCNRDFPPGQVVYAEKDPRTQEIRYIGRTGNAKRRHAEHMRNVSPELSGMGEVGTERHKEYYGRRAWMHDLKQLGLKPIQVLLPWSDIPAQVVEWEQRYIWHALQQSWPITNFQCAMDDLISAVKASGLDFIKAPFERLVADGFFQEKGIEAFVRAWYEP